MDEISHRLRTPALWGRLALSSNLTEYFSLSVFIQIVVAGLFTVKFEWLMDIQIILKWRYVGFNWKQNISHKKVAYDDYEKQATIQ